MPGPPTNQHNADAYLPPGYSPSNLTTHCFARSLLMRFMHVRRNIEADRPDHNAQEREAPPQLSRSAGARKGDRIPPQRADQRRRTLARQFAS